MSIVITGSSDDLIDIEGDISEEFSHLPHDDGPAYLAFSDGTLLQVQYDGVWRITTLKKGACQFSKEEAEEADSDNYSDRVTLTGKIRWVAYATKWANQSKKR
jgi:hypothetical protein